MATRTSIRREDDFDGTPIEDDNGGETITFSVRGVMYVIDLAQHNVVMFDQVWEPWINAARRETPSRAKRIVSSTQPPGYTNDVRAWAREQGLTVGDKGRISAEVQGKYDAAHS